ncbi:hypothetical protein GCM10011611_64800 [Aliidongia dinghuensis]|uniref:HTH tetR-type domain-containing protein n=1 Tax=Aliidongia dinghuensis TaxID=1867774 RepID=A0A8J3E5Q3_9PROT|nr:TetR/AcrR family transcriptional regulator [Aliidongia dinghuensis]GGF49420.1 hypothetical protein GCM10011611_64800 [Aliidongia dinghuensis]
MEAIDTRDALKVAAMRLFAERGVEAVSVRDIILESGAKNGGSLNYYFGTKEGLIAELLREIFEAASEHWLDGLSELLKKGGPASVREVVRIIAYAPPLLLRGEQYPTGARFLASLLFTRRKFVAEQMRLMNLSVFNRLLAYVRELQPNIPDSVMGQRLVFVAWYMSAILSAREAAFSQSRGNSKLWTQANALGNLVDTATALIEAPVEDGLNNPDPAEQLRAPPRSTKKPAARASRRGRAASVE